MQAIYRLAQGLVAVLFLFAMARPARAAGQPARLQADEVVFDYGAQVLVATGNARLSYKEAVITADRIEVDMKRNTLVARGRVTLTEKDHSFSAEELEYDLESEEGRVGSFSGRLMDEGAKGAIYFSGEALEQTEEAITARDLSLTTCDREDPHYHFTAAEIDYYPRDRLILRRVYYWEGHLRLFYLPYLAFTLKERANHFSFPRFGYNEVEGFFLKLAYNFFVGDSQSGTVSLDLTERKGIGEGLKYAWELKSGGEIWTSVYHRGGPAVGDGYRFEAGLNLPLAGAKLQSQFALADEAGTDGRYQTYQLGLRLSGSGGPQGTLNYRVSNAPGSLDEILDLSASTSWQPWEGATLNLQGRWYWSGDSLAGSSYKENYEARFVQSFPAGSFSAVLNSQVTPGYVLAYLPELKLDLPRLSLGGLGRFGLSLAYQRKIQETTTFAVEGRRLAADLSAQPRTLATYGPLSLQATAWAKGRVYDTGETVLGAAPELALVAKIGESIESRAGLSWVVTKGRPPSLFSGDALTPRANLSLGTNYRRGYWQGSLTTGYAFATGLWQPVLARLSWSDPAGDSFSLTTSYDPNTVSFGLTTLILGWRPKKGWSFRLNAGYDPGAAQWRQLDFAAELKQDLGAYFAIGFAARYDFFQEAWLQARLALDYKWHCRTLTFGYDWARREITLVLSINAFPEYPLTLSYSESGFVFTPPVMLP